MIAADAIASRSAKRLTATAKPLWLSRPPPFSQLKPSMNPTHKPDLVKCCLLLFPGQHYPNLESISVSPEFSAESSFGMESNLLSALPTLLGTASPSNSMQLTQVICQRVCSSLASTVTTTLYVFSSIFPPLLTQASLGPP